MWPIAIGVAAGNGREATAVLSALLAFVILWAVPRLLDALGVKDDHGSSS